jgi:hypothetical protein
MGFEFVLGAYFIEPDFQFFSPKLAQLQERELAVHKVGDFADDQT